MRKGVMKNANQRGKKKITGWACVLRVKWATESENDIIFDGPGSQRSQWYKSGPRMVTKKIHQIDPFFDD